MDIHLKPRNNFSGKKLSLIVKKWKNPGSLYHILYTVKPVPRWPTRVQSEARGDGGGGVVQLLTGSPHPRPRDCFAHDLDLRKKNGWRRTE